MKLVSCENCGSVIDTDRIKGTDKEYQVFRSGFVGTEPGTNCPVCNEEICLSDGGLT